MAGLVDGIAVGATAPLWSVIKPTSAVNLVTNPSFETNTNAWTPTSATISRVVGGVFGAWCAGLLASAANGRADVALPQATAGQPVTESVYVLAWSPLVFLQLIQDAATVEVAHPGDGLWHRLEVTATAATATTRSLRIINKQTSGWGYVYVDAAQYEQGVAVATTYIDGDQDGCLWDLGPHASTSTRDGRDGRGGQIVSLDSIGVYVTEPKGIGAPEMDVGTQPRALGDGELYQQSRAKMRVMTLLTTIFGTGGAGGLASLHTIRRGLLDLLKPDIRTGRGPVMLRYAGSAVPKRIAAYFETSEGEIKADHETIPLRFVAPDPDWLGDTDESAALAGALALTVGRVAYRDRDSVWSALGDTTATAAGTGIKRVGRLPDGRIVAAGYFTDMGGVANADNMAVWNGTVWDSLGGVAPLVIGVECMTVTRNGDVYIGGNFLDFAGIANADRIAKWTYATNTWSALSTGANALVKALVEDPATGYIWATGDFTTIGGVTVVGAAVWNGAAWAAVGSGPGGGDIVVGPDGRIYCTGVSGVYVWTGAAWSLIGLTVPASNNVNSLFTANGLLYAGGSFTSIGGVAANRIASWNGTAWSPLGAGVSAGVVYKVGALKNGTVYASGVNWGTVGGVVPVDNIAEWNGSTWSSFLANPPDTGTHANDRYYVWVLPDDSVAVSWDALSGTFGTTAIVPAITSVTNSGSASAYPVITLSGSAYLWSIQNLTTGQIIRFSGISLAVVGTITIDLRPGRKTVMAAISSLMNYVLPGSDLATFRLVPGVNRIAVFSDASTTVTIRWKPRYWSAD